jgi:transcriptional regulator with AAA-type ATPase domain
LVRDIHAVLEPEVELLGQLVEEHMAASTRGERSSRLLMTVERERSPHSVRALIDEVGTHGLTQRLASTPERIPGLVKRTLDRVDPHSRYTMSPAALQSFVHWSWPGNLSELVDVVTSLVRDVPGSVIQRRHLPQHLQQALPRRQLSMLEAAEREAIIKALDATGGNKSEAADLLGMGRTTLYRRLKHFNLDGDESSL